MGSLSEDDLKGSGGVSLVGCYQTPPEASSKPSRATGMNISLVSISRKVIQKKGFQKVSRESDRIAVLCGDTRDDPSSVMEGSPGSGPPTTVEKERLNANEALLPGCY